MRIKELPLITEDMIVKSFNNKSLTLSDILLASNINRNPDEGTIKRKDISILPNPTGIFSKGSGFIYLL